MLSIKNCLSSNFSTHYNRHVVHRILFIRHGETNCNLRMTKEGLGKFELDSSLTLRGERQGTEIAKFLKDKLYIPNIVLTSPLRRAIDTCKPFSANNYTYIDPSLSEINTKQDEFVYIEPNLHERYNFPKRYYKEENKQKNGWNSNCAWLYKKESTLDFQLRVSEWFKEQMSYGSKNSPIDTLCFTHFGVIATILGMYHSYHLKSNEYDDVKKNLNHRYHLANGSITCIDVLDVEGSDKRRTHITTVNYTRHLSEPTGHHNGFI